MLYSPKQPTAYREYLGMSIQPHDYSIPLLEKLPIARDLLQLRFQKPDGFSFLAGQFVQFLIPFEGRFLLRSYSISSSPDEPFLEFCVKLLPDGKASGHFLSMNEGGAVAMRGPNGRFILQSNSNGSYFIATGAGLAPVMSMISHKMAKDKNGHEIRLLFGVRTEEDVFWIDRLEACAAENPMFSYALTLSQPKPDGGWKGLRGRVTEHILHHLVDHHFYLCGNAAMIKDVRGMLLENGIEPAKILFEIF